MNSSSDESIGNAAPSSSRLLPKSTYISCIKIDGRPILPPLMTEAKRVEMQKYKELAMAVESRLQCRKALQAQHNQQTLESVATGLISPHLSTVDPLFEIPTSINPMAGSKENLENMVQPKSGFDQHFVIRETLKNVQPEPQPPRNEREETDEGGCSSDSSTDIFASVGSSTDTFIIKGVGDNKDTDSGGSHRLEDETDSEDEVPSTTQKSHLAKSKNSSPDQLEEREDLILSCKRKRPAFYFDEADDDEESEILSTVNTTFEGSEQSRTSKVSSVSLNPFLPPDVTWSSAGNSFPDADNSAGRDVTTDLSPRSAEQREFFGHGNSSIAKCQDEEQDLFTPKSRTPFYDVTLSTKIPSSAESSPVKIHVDVEDKLDKLDSRTEEVGGAEYDSDKENNKTPQSHPNFHKKHVRKLSYTLDQPSDALLASGMRAGDAIDNQDELHPIPAFTIPSVTPMKCQLGANLLTMPTPTAEELDSRLETLDHHLQQLQIGVELKKKHLERHREDEVVGSASSSTKTFQSVTPTKFSPRRAEQKSTPIKDFQKEIEDKFKQLQIQQQKQLEYLMEVHREQERSLKEDFDRQRVLLLGQLGTATIPSTTSYVNKELFPIPKSLPTTSRNLQSDFEHEYLESSGSIQHSTNPFVSSTSVVHSPSTQGSSLTAPPDHGHNYDVLCSDHDTRSALTTVGPNYASDWAADFGTEAKSADAASANTSTTNTLTELSTVGLSKLQAKMKALSPHYRTMGGEAKSPLLKGVAFPNPLNRSHAQVRVPPKALEADMFPKYARVSACVRGYLTRRLLHTDKIQTIIQTIRDTVDFVLRLYEEDPANSAHLRIKPEDLNLHRMLIQQLNGACSSFHGIFFKLTTVERMAIIATDRQKLKAKAMKEHSLDTSNSGQSKFRRNVSTATMKAIDRRLSHAGQQVRHKTFAYQPSREMPSLDQENAKTPTLLGSKSVNRKPFAKPSISISPSSKRRRLSHYVFKPPRNVSATIDTGLPKRLPKSRLSILGTPKVRTASGAAATDPNGNNWKRRASVAKQGATTSATVSNQLHHDTTYTMKGTGFQANPARIETNFSGVETVGQDIFSNPPTSVPVPTTSKLNQAHASGSTWRQSNTSTSTTSAASSRFSVGSNHSGGSSSSTKTNTTAGRGTSRKSVGKNVKPWK